MTQEVPATGVGRNLTSYGDAGFGRFIRMAFDRRSGLGPEGREKPAIAICDATSEVNRCHTRFGPVVEAPKRGILMQGGLPMTFPTISLGEFFTSPTTMLWSLARDGRGYVRLRRGHVPQAYEGCEFDFPRKA